MRVYCTNLPRVWIMVSVKGAPEENALGRGTLCMGEGMEGLAFAATDAVVWANTQAIPLFVYLH